jgi:hypothetical protein
MFTTYVPDRFHTPSSDKSLFISIRQKAKYKVHAAATLLSYILQHYYFNESVIIFNRYYHTPLRDPGLNGTTVVPYRFIRQKAKYKFHATAIYFSQSLIIFEDIIIDHLKALD